MLDAETKRKIDSARDILVGKVPDPKAQVEQITTALIYKFMDDMDREAEELGGKATFLTGELETYQWANLMSKELGGEARLNLYMSALLAFSKTPTIPEIFRTIFKDAFLPYRDPETLNLFLKQIDWFDYDHSENLGDAFEYLLSVLGSQGDAGQFRTPRHIIDFIVEVIEPKKTDTILDPSCGTAGFLISAYKHILANNTTLTPSEKKQLVQHFTGYDISPDMVRLSLVNLYLHSFPTPKVYEYDTLTSEDRWQENFDVILANPPFMTPKGGIRPHNRFSVQAKRSEVLFVDYIAEHLNLNGRAGIIVPEGIIFQSANAYKALRKMLVDNHFLWAVVSLPAGVFQPYSGVKTSILLLDRGIAKQRDDVLFIKLASDGYDLGAQRRETTTSDLPTALGILKAHRRGDEVDNPMAQVVAKAKIAETGDYNLTGDRYRETKARDSGVYPLVKLGEVCLFENGDRGENYPSKSVQTQAGVPFINAGHLVDCKISFEDMSYIPRERFELLNSGKINKNDILFCLRGTLGKCATVGNLSEGAIASSLVIIRPKKELLIDKLFLYFIQSDIFSKEIENVKNGVAQPNLSVSSLKNIEIPLPPLEIQNAIVAEIEQWQKVIDGAKQVIANYRPTIYIKPDWEMVKLESVCEDFKNGVNFSKEQAGRGYKFINIKDIFCDKSIDVENLNLVDISENEMNRFKVCKGDLLFVRSSVKYEGVGYTALYDSDDTDTVFCGFVIKCTPNKKMILSEYLLYLLRTNEYREKIISLSNKSNITNISQDSLKSLIIPLPPLENQNAIVEKIEQERTAVESCKTLIALFETKIKNKIAQVWGE